MAAAESPLVPASKHAGGALIAVDPDGQEAKLSLRKYHIDVHIEDGFARTTIDQTYFNHNAWRLEGTFYFPLPPDASLSRLAMYVDGNLMEGGMAERDYARNVFEEIVYRQKDPALLEWVDGSTFKMRVFPLEARQEKRIILSYTQRLPALYGRTTLSLPGRATAWSVVRDWSFHARVKDGAGLAWSQRRRTTLKAGKAGRRPAARRARSKGVKARPRRGPDAGRHGDGAAADEVPRFSSAEHDGASYLMLRYRPDAAGETAGDRRAARLGVPVRVVRRPRSAAGPDADRDRPRAAGQRRARRHLRRPDRRHARAGRSRSRKPATAENVQAALAFLENSAPDRRPRPGPGADRRRRRSSRPARSRTWSTSAAASPPWANAAPTCWPSAFPTGTRYVGVGVGKRWSRGFMKPAAERTGGYFTQINPDEPIAWRTLRAGRHAEHAAPARTSQVDDSAGEADRS